MIKRLLFVFLAGFLPILAHASAIRNYTGHYELADNHHERIFTLDLSQSGSRVQANFSASIVNVPGADPAGEGKGRVNDRGILEFTFKDNFANEGVATVESTTHGYQVEMRITKLVDMAPLHFYGNLTFKKMSDTAQKMAAAG